jgi:hypothetical protein
MKGTIKDGPVTVTGPGATISCANVPGLGKGDYMCMLGGPGNRDKLFASATRGVDGDPHAMLITYPHNFCTHGPHGSSDLNTEYGQIKLSWGGADN